MVEDPATGTTHAIKSTAISQVDGEDGWRTITITSNFDNLNAEVRKQTLMLYVTDNDYNLILSRDVDITVRPALNMTVKCNPTAIPQVIRTNLDVNINIPVQIDQLLFPLDFIIEAEKSSIYPNHDDDDGYMPVNVGTSLVPNNSQSETTVRYVKTITWEEYIGLTPTNGLVCIRCPFLTNKAASASNIYVKNTYFNLGFTSFTNQ